MTGAFGKRIFFFDMALVELEEIREQVNTQCRNARVCLARGAEMQCWRDLMRDFSAVLQFPDYFGWNRDAFSDCMADLGWLGEETICLLIKDYDVALFGERIWASLEWIPEFALMRPGPACHESL